METCLVVYRTNLIHIFHLFTVFKAMSTTFSVEHENLWMLSVSSDRQLLKQSSKHLRVTHCRSRQTANDVLSIYGLPTMQSPRVTAPRNVVKFIYPYLIYCSVASHVSPFRITGSGGGRGAEWSGRWGWSSAP